MLKKAKKILTSHLVLIIIIISLAFFLRLYKLDAPLADWHSWRQSDTASVTREFVKHSYSILEPHYQDLSNIPNGLNNLEGYRMVEFPLINYSLAQIIKTFPNLDLVVTSRLASVIASLFSIWFLYGIVWKLSKSKFTSSLAALIFALLPYSVFYSRVILPEPFMISFQLLSLFSFSLWLELENKKAKLLSTGYLLLAIFALAIAFLLKPTTAFIAPVFITLAIHKFSWGVFKKWQLYLFPLAIIPLLLWRNWINQFPEGIPAFKWLLNGNGIRLRPAWWRWLFADRLGKLILGYWGSIFLSLGIISKTKSKFDFFTLSYAGSMFLYLVVFATGNVQHDYYQAILIPVIAILVARGISFLLALQKANNYKFLTFGVTLLLLSLSLGFSFYEVRGYFNINNPNIVLAGKKADQILPADAKVIAPYFGDTAFLFQTNRTGWPIGGDIEGKIELGATHYISTNYDKEAKKLEDSYRLLEKTPEYIIIELSQEQN